MDADHAKDFVADLEPCRLVHATANPLAGLTPGRGCSGMAREPGADVVIDYKTQRFEDHGGSGNGV